MPHEKKPPRKTLQPDAQRSSGGAVNLEARISSELCAGEQIVEPSAAKPQAAEEAEDEDEALGSSVEDQYITVEELQKDLSRLLQEKTSSQEIIKWLQVRVPPLLHIRAAEPSQRSAFQATIDDDDASSDDFLEVLMTCVCHSEVIVCKPDLWVQAGPRQAGRC